MDSFGFLFLANSVLLGIGLSMDAFSVSLADGLCEAGMPKRRMAALASVFGFFQALMPMVGWVCVHTLARRFQAFARLVPWIALALLVFLGVRMLVEGARKKEVACPVRKGPGTVLLQGVATSIDALSVGFAIASFTLPLALVCSLVIALTTFCVCLLGLALGKRCAVRLQGKASILGGAILIIIGLEIFLRGVL